VSAIVSLHEMKRLVSLLSLSVLIAGCSSRETRSITREQAIQIARDYVKETSPELDISQHPVNAEFFTNNVLAVVPNGNWNIHFAVPAPRGPDGKIIGVRPFVSLDVYVTPEGKVAGISSHTP